MKLRLLLALALSCASFRALAVDSYSVEVGRGDHDTSMIRAGLQWNLRGKAFPESGWRFAPYLDLALGGWNGEHGTVYDLGLTPVFRFARPGGSPYVEAAIGFHLISELQFHDGTETSTRFQFGDHVGFGFRLDGRNELTLRLQHLSNGGIRNPNPGINFLQLRLQHALR
jgi:lipid A 3-O-deacylase